MRNRPGVRYHKQIKKWQASISVNGKRFHLGSFSSEAGALRARSDAESHYRVCKTFPPGHSPVIDDWKYLFDYDAESGRLINRVHRNNGSIAGSYADPVSGQYRFVTFLGKHYRAHRIIWEMHHGQIPPGLEIDHINRGGADNRLSNLRVVTSHENNLNLGRRSDCRHVTGVFYATKDKKWRATIGYKNRRVYLGDFDSKGLAIEARKKAEREFGFIGER